MSKKDYRDKTFARIYAFKYIYKFYFDGFQAIKNKIVEDERELNKSFIEFEELYLKKDEEHIDNILGPRIQKFAHRMIKGYLNNEDDIIVTITSFLKKRDYKSIGNIEKTILGLGTYEVKFEDTPNGVVINEFLNLNKKYGIEESVGFINGVLDSISKELP